MTFLSKTLELKSLEQFRPAPNHYRANYSTHDLEHFIGYSLTHASAEAGIFVDAEGMSAIAIFDMGDPLDPAWGKHRAMLSLKKSAAYQALIDKADQSLGQNELIEFLEDWSDCVTCYAEDGTDMTVGQAVQLIRRIDLKATAQSSHEVANFSASRSAMEEIEARSAGGKLPAYFVMDCAPYEALKARAIHCKLRLKITGDKPALAYRIIAEERMNTDMAREFCALITSNDELGGKCSQIHIGKMDYQ